MSLLYRVRTKRRFLVFSFFAWGLPVAVCLILLLGVYDRLFIMIGILFAGALGTVVFAELAWRMGIRDLVERHLPYVPELANESIGTDIAQSMASVRETPSSPRTVMKLTYQPNFPDSFHGVLFGFWGTRRGAFQSLIFGLIFASVAAWLVWDQPLSLGLRLFIAVAGGALWIAGFSIVFGAVIATLITMRQKARGSDTLEISEAGLERTSGALSVKQQWAGIQRVKETSRAFILFDAGRPVFAIEKSAVPNPADLNQLRRLFAGRKLRGYLPDSAS